MVQSQLFEWATLLTRRLKWAFESIKYQKHYLQEALAMMEQQAYLPKVFMVAMENLAVTTLDDDLLKRLHDRIMMRVFNAQSKEEIRQYLERKLEMRQQDTSRMALRAKLLGRVEDLSDKRKRKSTVNRKLFPKPENNKKAKK